MGANERKRRVRISHTGCARANIDVFSRDTLGMYGDNTQVAWGPDALQIPAVPSFASL